MAWTRLPAAGHQIQRRPQFWTTATIGTLIMIVVTVSWALTEYHDAVGWPAPWLHPELAACPERAERLDRLDGQGVGAVDRWGRLMYLRAQADPRTRDPARDRPPGRSAGLAAGGMPL